MIICPQELSNIAQSGHTGLGIGYEKISYLRGREFESPCRILDA